MKNLLIGMGLSLTACGTVGSCVARGTRVRVPGGSALIENLRVGDEIVVAEPSTGTTAVSHLRKVTSALRECGSLTIDGRQLMVTSDHPLYDPVAKGFFPAGDWLLGDRRHLLEITDDGPRTIEVAGAKLFCAVSEVFDLTVEHEWHTFLAEDVLVHNKTPPQCITPTGEYVGVYSLPSDRPLCDCDGGLGRWTCNSTASGAVCSECGKVLPDGGTIP